MALTMDERLLPSYFTVSYDDISYLANEEHTQAFLITAKKFFEKLIELFHEDIEIELPANLYSPYAHGGWIPLKHLLIEAEDFLACLYYHTGCDEWLTKLKTPSNQYLLSLCMDPVVYNVKRISNTKKTKGFFLGWFK